MENRTRIFGMAKSSLNLSGAKRQKVELDYLRLVYARNKYPHSKAYMVVTDEKLKKTVLKWAGDEKYASHGLVEIMVLPFEKLTKALTTEKINNVRGMVSAITGEGTAADAVAALGEQICEEYLLELMRDKFPAIEFMHHVGCKVDYRTLPLGVNWDFYAEYGG